MILIRHPDHYPAGNIIDPLEVVVIHELLHLHFAPLKVQEPLCDAMEQAIDSIAWALYLAENPKAVDAYINNFS